MATMKLGLIAQIRDEIDIIETWLNHVDSLFDRVYLIDHQSIDGTGELLKQAVSQREDWEYYFLDCKTKLQAEVSTLVMHEAFAKDLDFLFFLDVDEFIQVHSRCELEHLLSGSRDPNTMWDLHWKNTIRGDLHEEFFKFESPLYVPEKESNHKKIIIPSEIYKNFGKELRIIYGNHSVFVKSLGRLNSIRMGTILHLPVRSRDQVEKKVILNVIAQRGFKNRMPGRSTHTYEMLKRIAEGKLTDNEVRGFTITYDSIESRHTSISVEDLSKQRYELTSFTELDLARNQSLFLMPVQRKLGSFSQIANALNNLEEDIPEYVKLNIRNNIITIDENDLKESFNRKIKSKFSHLITILKNVRKG